MSYVKILAQKFKCERNNHFFFLFHKSTGFVALTPSCFWAGGKINLSHSVSPLPPSLWWYTAQVLGYHQSTGTGCCGPLVLGNYLTRASAETSLFMVWSVLSGPADSTARDHTLDIELFLRCCGCCLPFLLWGLISCPEGYKKIRP